MQSSDLWPRHLVLQYFPTPTCQLHHANELVTCQTVLRNYAIMHVINLPLTMHCCVILALMAILSFVLQ